MVLLHLAETGKESFILIDAALKPLLRPIQVLLRRFEPLVERFHLVRLALQLIERIIPAVEQGAKLLGHISQLVHFRPLPFEALPQFSSLCPRRRRLFPQRLQFRFLRLQRIPFLKKRYNQLINFDATPNLCWEAEGGFIYHFLLLTHIPPMIPPAFHDPKTRLTAYQNCQIGRQLENHVAETFSSKQKKKKSQIMAPSH